MPCCFVAIFSSTGTKDKFRGRFALKIYFVIQFYTLSNFKIDLHSCDSVYFLDILLHSFSRLSRVVHRWPKYILPHSDHPNSLHIIINRTYTNLFFGIPLLSPLHSLFLSHHHHFYNPRTTLSSLFSLQLKISNIY